MKKTTKTLGLLMAVLMLGTLLTGCGKKQEATGYVVLEEDLGAEQYGIGFRKTDVALGLEVQAQLDAMIQDIGAPITSLRADGGASANNFLMQFQADLLDTQVVRPSCIETTALGASYLAGLATGFWKDASEVKSNWQIGQQFTPRMTEEERKKKLKGWKKAVKCTFEWAKDEEE